jgi:hypothetical protein
MAGVANLRSPSDSARPILGREPNGDTSQANGRPAPGTSIIAISPIVEGKKFTGNSRPAAVFLAQLIATAQQAPQTRQRRRAEGRDVVARYASAIPPYAPTGRTLRSSI